MRKEEGFIKGYYFHQLDNALHCFKRSVLVGFCLICLKSYWLFCLILSSGAVEQTSYYYDSYYTNVFGASLLKGYSDGIVFVVAGLIVNSIIILLICIDMILWRWREKMKKSIIHSLRMILSVCAQTYTYAVFIPFAFHSIDSSDSPVIVSVLCFASSIILNIFFLIHDQDYRFIQQDGLDRRNAYFWDCGTITLEMLSCIALSRFKTEGAFAFGAAYAGYRLLFIHQNRPFSQLIIQYIDAFSGIYILLLSLSLLIAEISSAIDSFPLVFIFLIPLSLKAAEILISKKQLRLEDFSKITKYTDYTYFRDGNVRQLLGNASELAFEEYSHKLQSILIEEIIINHKENCSFDKCFCQNEVNNTRE